MCTGSTLSISATASLFLKVEAERLLGIRSASNFPRGSSCCPVWGAMKHKLEGWALLIVSTQVDSQLSDKGERGSPNRQAEKAHVRKAKFSLREGSDFFPVSRQMGD